MGEIDEMEEPLVTPMPYTYEQIDQRLYELGYLLEPGALDEMARQEALAAFQGDNLLEPTGLPDEATLALLFAGIEEMPGDQALPQQ